MNPYSSLFKFVSIDGTSDGDNEVVAAVTGRRIRVLGIYLSADAAGQVAIKSGSTVIGKAEFIASNLSQNVSMGGVPVFQTASGEALVINTTASQDIAGFVTYVLVA